MKLFVYFTCCILLVLSSCKKKENKDAAEASATTTGTASTTTTGGSTTGSSATTGGGTTGAPVITYSKVKIIDIKVTEVDFEGPYYFDWDANDGPDIYYQIYTGTNTNIKVDGYDDMYENVTDKQLPLYFKLDQPYVINDLETEFGISLYDDDGSTREYMGGVIFRFRNNKEGYPTTLEKTLYKAKIKFTLQWFN